MTTERSRVTVVIPCFNHGEFLREAVASVLDGKRSDIELLVVDDGSTDERTRELMDVLAREGIRVVRQENRGLSAARNAGVRVSEGEYVFPLDADDRLRDGWIDRAIEVLEERPEVGIVYGDAQFFGVWTHRWTVGPIEPELLLEKNQLPASALFRRSVWEQNGGYDETMLQGYEDWEFWIAA